eukprot:10932193-Alexandrium_andersonii.AAC.1
MGSSQGPSGNGASCVAPRAASLWSPTCPTRRGAASLMRSVRSASTGPRASPPPIRPTPSRS